MTAIIALVTTPFIWFNARFRTVAERFTGWFGVEVSHALALRVLSALAIFGVVTYLSALFAMLHLGFRVAGLTVEAERKEKLVRSAQVELQQREAELTRDVVAQTAAMTEIASVHYLTSVNVVVANPVQYEE